MHSDSPKGPMVRKRRPRKPRGYWDDSANLFAEIAQFNKEAGVADAKRMPTSRELRAEGRRDIDNAVSKSGGYYAVAAKLGFVMTSSKRVPGFWAEFSTLEEGIKSYLESADIAEGLMPTLKELREARRSDIVEAIEKHGGVLNVAERLGLAPRSQKKARFYWRDWSRVETALQAFVAERLVHDGSSTSEAVLPSAPVRRRKRPKMPSQNELREAGRSDLAEAIAFHGGFRNVAKKMGYVSKKDDFFYSMFYNLAKELYAFLEEIGEESVLPSTTVFKSEGRTDLSAAIVKYGGMSSVSQRLGLQYKVRTRESFKAWPLFCRNLMVFIDKHGTHNHIPSSRTLINHGRGDLYQAILHHGGSQEVAERLRFKRSNFWQEFHYVGAQLLSFIDTHGTEGVMPTDSEFLEVGRTSLNVAVSKFGFSQVAQRLGLRESSQSTNIAFDSTILINSRERKRSIPRCAEQ